jgi:DNA modification methylase
MTNDPLHKPQLDLLGELIAQPSRGPLADRFQIPPFSVLNAREGEWQDRKREWTAMGIKSELGRGAMQASLASARGVQTGDGAGQAEDWCTTSIFDPVLCELAYRWFCPFGGQVIDPFCGGSVRGIVAATMGMRYFGCDLSQQQVQANKEQVEELWPKVVGMCEAAPVKPQYVCGDARNVLAQLADDAPFHADFIFTCPPYFDLEIYSELKQDLSNMTWSHFCEAYYDIIEKAARRIKLHRFACFVVGDIRDTRTGAYRNLPGLTTQCFLRAGFTLHNEAILVTSVGTLPVRAQAAFQASRKLGKTHQTVLVYCKGDPEKAAAQMRMAEPPPKKPK